MYYISSFGMFVGRVLLGVYFLWSGIVKFLNYDEQLKLFTEANVPEPHSFLVAFLIIQLLGGISLILGWYVWFGAFILIVSRIFGVIYFHDFWNHEGKALETQQLFFLQNVALIGGLLYVFFCGPGLFAITGRKRKSKQPKQAAEPANTPEKQ